MSRKLIVTDAAGTRELLLVGTMAVGREPACEISADDSLLSRRHAEFRVTSDGVVLADLDSRNGLRVNGVATKRAVLRDGDQIEIAGFLIRLVDESGPVTSSSDEDDDGTVDMMMPPAPTQAPRSFVQALAVADGDDDRTIFRPPPNPIPSVPVRPNAVAPMAREPRPVPRAASSKAPIAEAKPRIARRARTAWAGRVFILVVGLGAFSALLVAIVMSFWQARAVRSIASARATAAVNWLAADAAMAAARGELSGAADDVARETGVVSALVIGLDGRVLSPASRSGERFETLPGLNVAPADVYRPRIGAGNGVVQVARPIGGQGSRQAVAFVSFRVSAGPDDSSSIVVLGPALLAVLAAALITASSIRRMTLQGLVRFTEDLDLAISGQLDEVKDSLGARPVRDLADTVNYLIARARGGANASALAVGVPHRPEKRTPDTRNPGPRLEHDEQSAGPKQQSGTMAVVEARVVVDERFRVTEASPDCAQIIGVSPKQMIGEHLVDALQQKPLVETVLTILGSLPASGQQEATIALAGLEPLTVLVARSGKNQPVTITIRTVDAAVRA